MKRYEDINGKVFALHKKLAPFRHWYLFILAVDPVWQGKGFGRKLLEPGLSRLDGIKMPCYLETFRADTAVMYEKFGFRLLQQSSLQEGKLQVFCMLRKPD